MKQQLLNLSLNPSQSLANFYAGPNRSVVDYLVELTSSIAENFVPSYIWGAASSGKTHLLHAVASCYSDEQIGWLDKNSSPELVYQANWQLICIDDVQQLSAKQQHLAFSWFVQAQTDKIKIISAGRLPPADLPIREDLRTRVGWGQIFQLQPLSDQQLLQLLKQQASLQGIKLSDEVINFILLHLPRDQQSIMQLLRCLDQESLQTKRYITIPLLKTVLKQQQISDEVSPI